jgi:long-chain fatty acid transport protein
MHLKILFSFLTLLYQQCTFLILNHFLIFKNSNYSHKNIHSLDGGTMLKKLSMIASAILVSNTLLFASGFSIYEQGAKATAMGGAFIAQANDVTGVFYNPAGITSLNGLQLGIGATIIMPSFSFEGPTPLTTKTDAKDNVFTPVTFYSTYKINEDLSAGFGFYTLYGLGSEWPDGWLGRQLATTSEVQTFFLNPVVAYRITKELSVAVGVSLVFANVSLERDVAMAPTTFFAASKLEGDATGFGYNIGLQYKVSDQLTVGGVFRGNTLLEFKDGDVTFDVPVTGIPQVDGLYQVALPNTKGTAEIELPTLMGLGISYQFTDNLVAEFDWMQLGWSSYDELKVEYDAPVGGETVSAVERNYEDSYSLRFGLEYMVNEQFAVRAGFLRDNKAVPDNYLEPTLPEGDRNLVSIGAGYTMNNLTIDAYFMLLQQDDRTIETSAFQFNGTYKGSANLFGVSFGYGL